MLRPDTAPICTRSTHDGRFAFVSLRGGGAFVIDHTATPMRIVAEYDRAEEGDVDAHGGTLTKHEKYLLTADRIQNDVTVVDTRKNLVVGSFSLEGPLSRDPAPDLVELSPDDKLAFFALRGPMPLSGGADAIGATPGLGVVALGSGGKDGELRAIARSPRPVTDPRPPDPHTVAVRVLR